MGLVNREPMALIPKNWKSFQHYKDRNPPWVKLHKSLLDNPAYQKLPDASKALAPMLWLLASEQKDGSIPMDLDELAFRLRCGTDKIIIALEPLINNGFFEDDGGLLAPCVQPAVSEERRGEAEKEKREITSPTAQRTKSPLPLEDLRLFTEHVWKNYPSRARDGKPLNKGHKPDALTRCLAIKGKWGMDWLELEAAVKRYHDFPNVKQGNVQAVEVFFGERGHWLEAWEWVKRQQQPVLEM